MEDILSKIYDDSNHNIIWDEVWKIDEFKRTESTHQNTFWHREGNVSNHLKMVVKEMDKMIPFDGTNGLYRKIMLLSALFHDIGKIDTTWYNPIRKDWSSSGHDEVGEKITRELLKDSDTETVEMICYFVRNHMKPYYIVDNPNGIREVIRLSCDIIDRMSNICNLSNLVLLKTCDCKGAIFANDDWEERLDFARDLANDLNCLYAPYEFKNGLTKYVYFNDSTRVKPFDMKEGYDFISYIFIGDKYEVDKLNYEKSKTIQISGKTSTNLANDVIDCCSDGNSFIISLQEFPKETWDTLFDLIYKCCGKIVFIYNGKTNGFSVSPNRCMSYIEI